MESFNITALELDSMYIPVFVSKLYDKNYELPQDSVFVVENSYEILISALQAHDPNYASKILDYWDLYKKYSENPKQYDSVDTVTISRALSVSRQVDSGSERKDLIEVHKFLSGMDFLKSLTDSLFSDSPDWDLIKSHPLCTDVFENGDVFVTTLVIEGQYDWIPDLGGTPSPNEVCRIFIITTSYAKWRDRKVRRIMSLESRAIEICPKPI